MRRAGSHVRNRRLADAIYLWAFASLTASPGARLYYDTRRAAGDTHHAALRALGNRLVGIRMAVLLTMHLQRDDGLGPPARKISSKPLDI